ncbi:hypothetical protein [Candidatus Poriferisodalis sp.]|uniref:hypothetical protein n=1 Tax=Candidatus Poriferisodalis sp. TaxID=3101277 RepID=UPI003B5BCE7F
MTPKGSGGVADRILRSSAPTDYVRIRMSSIVSDVAENLEICDNAPFADVEENLVAVVISAVETPWNPWGDSVGVAIRHFAAIGGTPGAIALAVLAAFGEPTVQPEARTRLRRLVDDGIEVPEWVHDLGTAEPISAVMTSDQWDEYVSLFVDYRRPDGTIQEVGAAFHPHAWGAAHGFSVRPVTASESRDVAEGHRVASINLAEARALMDHGLAEFDRASLRRIEAADELDGDPDWGEADDDLCLRALIGHFVRLLPSGGELPEAVAPAADRHLIGDDPRADRQFTEAVERFVADRSLAEDASALSDLVLIAAMFANSCWIDDVFRWNPPRVKIFLEQWIPNFGFESGGAHMDSADYRETVEYGFEPSGEWLATLDAALPRWLRLAAERRCHSDELLHANLAAARDSLRELRRKMTGSPVPLTNPPLRFP